MRTSKGLLRRTALAGVLSLACGGLQAQERVSFAGYGGEPQKVQAKAFFEPAAKELGISVLQDSHGGYAKIKAQVMSGSPGYDLVALGCAEAARAAKEGLLEPLDYSLIPNANDVDQRLRAPHHVGEWTFSTVLAWNTKTVKTPPKTWAEFWDVKKFPGKRALSANARQMLEIALVADGVPADKLYPLDLDRAFKKLEEIKPHLTLWWSSGAQSVQLLNDGEVDMLAAWNGRVQAAMDAGASANYTYNQGIYDVECFMVPKGAKNKAQRHEAHQRHARAEEPGDRRLPHRLRPGQSEGLRHRDHSGGAAEAASLRARKPQAAGDARPEMVRDR